jgi:outer membrane protein OmpA-like peptidoglycan-associated protein
MAKTSVLAAVVAAGLAAAGCAQVSGAGARVQIASTPHCTDFFFPISFANKSPALTRQAQRVVAEAGVHARGCTIAKVEVVGLADDRGPPEPNRKLSRERARRLADALTGAGLPAPAFRLRAVGEEGPVAEDVARPVRRRTEVFVTFAQ